MASTSASSTYPASTSASVSKSYAAVASASSKSVPIAEHRIISCLTHDGKKLQYRSSAQPSRQHFQENFGDYPEVSVYGLFPTDRRQRTLEKEVHELLKDTEFPLHRWRSRRHAHIPLAHAGGRNPYDGAFISYGMNPKKLNIKTVFVRCREIVCTNKLVVLVFDPETVPYCQSPVPHMTLATFTKINLRDDPLAAIADPDSYRVPFTATLSLSLNCLRHF